MSCFSKRLVGLYKYAWNSAQHSVLPWLLCHCSWSRPSPHLLTVSHGSGQSIWTLHEGYIGLGVPGVPHLGLFQCSSLGVTSRERDLHRKLQDDNRKSKQPTNWVHRSVHHSCHKMVTANTGDPRNSLGDLCSCWDFRELYEIVKSKFFSGLNNAIRKKYVTLFWFAALGTLTNLAAS